MDRFDVCSAYYIVASRYHSGQWSKGYRKLSQLVRMGFRPSLSIQDASDPGARNAAAALLWKNRRDIKRNW
jgi:hypothetical protein